MINFFRHLFLKDFGLKLFSLLLAVMIWLPVSFAIRQPQSTPMTISALGLAPHRRTFSHLPVMVVSSTVDARKFKSTPAEVEVTVEGNAVLLDNLQSAEIRAMVVFTGAETAGENVKKVEVSTPPGVACSEVKPSEVQVNRTE